MRRKFFILLLCFCLSGCVLLEPAGPPEWRDSSSSDASSQPSPSLSEASPEDAAWGAQGTALEGVEGAHLVLEENGWSPNAFPSQMAELSDLVVVALREGEGAPLLIEGYDTRTGARRFSRTEEGLVYAVERAGQTGESCRIVRDNAVTLLNATDGSVQEVYALPESVLPRLYAPQGCGAPYDYDREANLLACALSDGVYISDGEGNNPRRLMSTEEAVRWFGYAAFDLPAYTWDQVHFISPLIMNGGEQIAATAAIVGENGARCVYVSTVNVETGTYSNYPDPLAESALPAKRLGENSLIAQGQIGVQHISVAEEEILEIPPEQSGQFALETLDGDASPSLRYYPNGKDREGSVLLAFSGWNAGEWISGDRFILCSASSGDGERKFLLAPYEKARGE